MAMSQINPSSTAAPQVLVDNVFFTTFPDKFHFSTHLHRTVELLICRTGRVVITIQGTEHVVAPGEYLVVFPDIPHSTDVPFGGPSQVLQTHFHAQSFQQGSNPSIPECEFPFSVELALGRRKCFKGKSSPQLEACLEGLHSERAGSKEDREVMIRLYLAQLGLLLSRDLLEQTSQTGLSTLYDNPHLVNAVLYINKHYMDKLSVNDVAGTVGVSSRYLTRLFCEHLDMGVSTYITYVRISKAIEFKHANPHYPLTDLALDIGFGSQQHFSKVFKEKMGVSPKKYFSIGTALG